MKITKRKLTEIIKKQVLNEGGTMNIKGIVIKNSNFSGKNHIDYFKDKPDFSIKRGTNVRVIRTEGSLGTRYQFEDLNGNSIGTVWNINLKDYIKYNPKDWNFGENDY